MSIKINERDRWIQIEFIDQLQRGDIILSGGVIDQNGELHWGETLWSDEVKKLVADKGIYESQKRRFIGKKDDKGVYIMGGKPDEFIYECLIKPNPSGGNPYKTVVMPCHKKLNLAVISDYLEYCYLLIQDCTVSEAYPELTYGKITNHKLRLKDIKIDTAKKRNNYRDRGAVHSYIEACPAEKLYNISIMIGHNPINMPIDAIIIKLHEYADTQAGLEHFMKNIMNKDINHIVLVEKGFSYGLITKKTEGFFTSNIFIGATKEQVHTYLSQTDDAIKGGVIAKLVNDIKVKDREYNRSYVEAAVANNELTMEIAKQDNVKKGRWAKKEDTDDKSIM